MLVMSSLCSIFLCVHALDQMTGQPQLSEVVKPSIPTELHLLSDPQAEMTSTPGTPIEIGELVRKRIHMHIHVRPYTRIIFLTNEVLLEFYITSNN